MPVVCNAIRANGTQCNRTVTLPIVKCGTHLNSVIRHGPNMFARRELGYIHKKEIADILHEFDVTLAATEDAFGKEQLRLNHIANIGIIRARQRRTLTDLVTRQRDEIRITGVDPDEPARRLNRERIAAANIRRREQMQQIAEQRNRIRAEMEAAPEPIPAPVPPILPIGRRLQALAADPQNVHTTEAVNQTKQIVELVRKVPVPEGYRWNTSVVSKTIGEIIAECQLTSHAAAQMFNQYVSMIAVYDIEEGIYGKVLDSVWQYIKNSPDKNDLCKIMKREMEDNVGMCAQGNLSRICNVLAGYMEGVGAQESLAERLGRLLPALMEIDDMKDRIQQGCAILVENKVPFDEWDTWMEPLLEDEYTEIYELIRDNIIFA
jgi:hypothetical protein